MAVSSGSSSIATTKGNEDDYKLRLIKVSVYFLLDRSLYLNMGLMAKMSIGLFFISTRILMSFGPSNNFQKLRLLRNFLHYMIQTNVLHTRLVNIGKRLGPNLVWILLPPRRIGPNCVRASTRSTRRLRKERMRVGNTTRSWRAWSVFFKIWLSFLRRTVFQKFLIEKKLNFRSGTL